MNIKKAIFIFLFIGVTTVSLRGQLTSDRPVSETVGLLPADSVWVQSEISDSLSIFDNRYYVSKQLGDDNNTGRSENDPFKTFAKVVSVVENGDFVYIRSGETFYESLQFSNSIDSITVTSYGAGRYPIINGADIITSWSKTGGYTNIYEADVTTENVDEDEHPVYENNETLISATSLANLDATAGAYFATINSPTSVTIYLHTTDSDNPSSNGNVYEVPVRDVLEAGDHVRFSRIHGVKSLNRAGMASTYRYGEKRELIVEDGTGHNEINAGGIIEGVTALNAKLQAASTFFVSYDATPQSLRATYNHCYAINTRENEDIDQSGFYAHGTGNNEWQYVAFINCGVSRLSTVANPVADSVIIKDGVFLNVENISLSNSNVDGRGSYQDIQGNQLLIVGDVVSAMPEKGQFYNNGVYITGSSSTHAFSSTVTDTLDLRNNTFYISDGRSFIRQGAGTSGTEKCSNYNNIYFGRPGSFYHVEVAASGYSGDYNIYFAKNNGGTNLIQVEVGGVTYTTLASFQAAVPGHEENSVYLTPDQAKYFWAGDPATGDFRINPDAEVTWVDPVDATYNNGNDIIKTIRGTFPDGTPLSEAGVLPSFPVGWRPMPYSVEDHYKIISK
jgi:hypothetical protein